MNYINQTKTSCTQLTPQEIVKKLDKHIIGQDKAKRAVAIALRNRYRRMQIPQPLRQEITPKNILMIGPTGVGKTEIARRLAKLAKAPFIKIEATKFTEVGYVGRDVESIIRDLVDVSVKLTKEEAFDKVKEKALSAAEERILDIIVPGSNKNNKKYNTSVTSTIKSKPSNTNNSNKSNTNNIGSANEDLKLTRQVMRKQLREGKLDDKEIEIEISHASFGVEIMAPPGMEEMTNQLQSIFQNLSSEKMKVRKMKIKDSLKLLSEEESAKIVNDEDIKQVAINKVEQNGIVFLDEIDKVTQRSGRQGSADVSREGVQRDLLPLIEGSTVSTRYGMIKTDHILFIASGSFHLAKPSDLIPELQGRLPIRVELDALKTEDFIKILTEPDASLTEQYKALLSTEGIIIQFTKSGIKELAEIAWKINEHTENIGARRLYTVIERVLEDVSFKATTMKDKNLSITNKYVKEQLEDITKNEDLSKFIL